MVKKKNLNKSEQKLKQIGLSQKKTRAVLKFIDLLKEDDVHVKEVIVFGSHVKDRARKGSDIDLCVISDKFKDAFEAMSYLMMKSYGLGAIIEPHPFHPKDFINEDPLVWEIKKTGVRVL